jgi:hypothetical protein
VSLAPPQLLPLCLSYSHQTLAGEPPLPVKSHVKLGARCGKHSVPTHRNICISRRHKPMHWQHATPHHALQHHIGGLAAVFASAKCSWQHPHATEADNALLVAYFKDGGHSHGDGLSGNMGLPEKVACSVHPGHPVQVHCPCPRVSCRPAWHAPSNTSAAVHCPHENGGQPEGDGLCRNVGPSKRSLAASTRMALPRSTVLVRMSLTDLHGIQQALCCSSRPAHFI